MSFSKLCAICSNTMKNHMKDKIWLISCDKRNDRVCNSCWLEFLLEDKITNGGKGKKEMDRSYNEKLSAVEGFLDWLARAECRSSYTRRKRNSPLAVGACE